MYRADNATATPTRPAATEPGPRPNGYYTEGDPTQGIPATIVEAEHLNTVQEELVAVAEAVGLALDKADNTQLLQAIRLLIERGRPSLSHDIAFMAGWGGDGAGADLAVQFYGAVILARDIHILSEVAIAEVAPTGAALVFDVLNRGASIYTTKPQIDADTGRFTAGVLTSGSDPLEISAGTRLVFRVTQIGSVIAGQKVAFTLKGQTR